MLVIAPAESGIGDDGELLASQSLEPPVHVLTARAWSGWGGLLGLGARLMVPGGRAVIFVGEDTLRALPRYVQVVLLSKAGDLPERL